MNNQNLNIKTAANWEIENHMDIMLNRNPLTGTAKWETKQHMNIMLNKSHKK